MSELVNKSRYILAHFNLDDTDGTNLLNIKIANDYMLCFEGSDDEENALLTMSKNVEKYDVDVQLINLFKITSIDKNLPIPLHVSLRDESTLSLMVRIEKDVSQNELISYLELMLHLYQSI